MVRRGSSKQKPSQVAASDDAEQSAIRFLARRDRTEAQVRAYLIRFGASPARAGAMIKSFRASGYVNDEAYALRWARARLTRRPMGRDRLEAELHGQGIDSATATRTLDAVYGEVSERDLARKLLEKKIANAGLLRRYGFSQETIDTFFRADNDQSSSPFSPPRRGG